MEKFIVGAGFGRVAIEHHPSQDAALASARSRAFGEGVEPECLDDYAWVEPYDDLRAIDLGLQEYEYND